MLGSLSLPGGLMSGHAAIVSADPGELGGGTVSFECTRTVEVASLAGMKVSECEFREPQCSSCPA